MAKRSNVGLGRGLEALMGDTQENELKDAIAQAGSSDAAPPPARNLPEGITVDSDGTLWVDPALLKPNPRQPRQYFDEKQLAELTKSVAQEGVLSPIIIEDAGDGMFYIIAGERRSRAARAAGLAKVPIQLRKYSDSRKLEVALIENIQRTDLNPVEEAQAYAQLMELEGISQGEVAERVGKDRSTVANSIRLLKLPDSMLHSLASGEITSGHARALLSVISSADQQVLYDRIREQGMTVRQAEQQAQGMNGGSRAARKKTGPDPVPTRRDPDYDAIEQKFIEALGTKVQLRGDFEHGSVTIDYFTKDDLDRIYNRIVEKQ